MPGRGQSRHQIPNCPSQMPEPRDRGRLDPQWPVPPQVSEASAARAALAATSGVARGALAATPGVAVEALAVTPGVVLEALAARHSWNFCGAGRTCCRSNRY